MQKTAHTPLGIFIGGYLVVTHSASARPHRTRAAQQRGQQPQRAAVDLTENGSTVTSWPGADVFPLP